MSEALELAEGNPLHLAHTNAYLRGSVADVVAENEAAFALLQAHRQAVSEAHLARLNLCFGGLDGGSFTDHIVTNCLRMAGYATDSPGLAQAFTDGYAHALRQGTSEATPLSGTVGYDIWASDPGRSALCFPVNRRITGFMQACARLDRSGAIRYEGPGEFLVDAISSDGGLWRNVILDHGLSLVEFGALSLSQFAHKTSLAPASLFGLGGKGVLAAGADADVVGIDPIRRSVRFTVIAGRVVFDGDEVVGTGGRVYTTEHGVAALREHRIPHTVLDLSGSEFSKRGRLP